MSPRLPSPVSGPRSPVSDSPTPVSGPRSPVPRPSTLDTRPPSSPLVTLAIPTYNRAGSYLPEALKCALDQTYPNLEIIVADNCSTDGTKSLAGGIADPRLRYFRHEENIGSTNNLNFCLEQAKGEYVLFLHDDDRIDPDFIESCIRAANGICYIGMIRTGVRWIDTDGVVRGEVPNRVGGLPLEEFFLGWFNGMTPMHPCSTLFNTKRLREVGGFHSKHDLFDDVMAEVKLAAKYNRVDVPEVKASFRHHQNREGEKQWVSRWCEDSLILLDTMCALVPASKAALVRSAGMRHFLRGNYRRAGRVRSFFSRLTAYGTVLKHFDYPVLQFISVVLSFEVFRRTRVMKKKVKEVLERAPGLKARIVSFRKVLSKNI